MDIKVASADTRSLPDSRSQPPGWSAREAAGSLSPRAALAVIVLSSLGLWAAIWWVATSLVSARL
jgi:hypothetical protein